MNILRNNLFVLLCLFFSISPDCYTQTFDIKRAKFEKSDNFSGFEMDENGIKWGYLTVPESWESDNDKVVKLGVTVLEARNNKRKAREAVIFIEGGPGQSAIRGIWGWLNHPMRENKDIILLDLRGTGYSEPKLCPDLGKSFMKLMAEDYDIQKETDERVNIAIACRDELVRKGIDLSAYNSKSMSFDLHALKESLGYNKWIVYSVSYGTRIALEYAKRFPEDQEKLILDSSVLPFSGLYDNNTSNFVRSLNLLFEKCNADEQCVKEYGMLEKLFYATVADLEKEPITVDVSPNIHPSGKFVLNAQDFILAVRLGLYDKQFFEVLPLMIKEFNNRNEEMISALVSALKGRLALDYGTYYCVLCNETLPVNSIKKFESDAGQFEGLVSEGLPFYKSDYLVCDKWLGNQDKKDVDSLAKSFVFPENIPTLILSGEFDPATPPANGEKLQKLIPNSLFVIIPNQGHGPSFYSKGKEILTSFVNTSNSIVKDVSLKNKDQISFENNIYINGGVYKFAEEIRKNNLSTIIPVVLSLIGFIVAVFYLPFVIWKNRRESIPRAKLINWGIIANSLFGISFIILMIYGIINTAQSNFYVLAFGLPNIYIILFVLPYIILAVTIIITFNFIKGAKIRGRIVPGIALISAFILLGEVFYLGLY